MDGSLFTVESIALVIPAISNQHKRSQPTEARTAFQCVAAQRRISTTGSVAMNTSSTASLHRTRRAIVGIASAVLIAVVLGIAVVSAFVTSTHSPTRGLGILPSTPSSTAVRAAPAAVSTAPVGICVNPGGPGSVRVPHRQGIVGGFSLDPSTTSRTAVGAFPAEICVYPGGPGSVHVPHRTG